MRRHFAQFRHAGAGVQSSLTSMIAPFALILAVQKPSVLTNKVDFKWELNAEIPSFPGSDPLSRLAKKTVTAKMTTDFNRFLVECKKDWTATGTDMPPYSFGSSAVRQMGDTQVQSYTIFTDRFLGGAHGMAMTECKNFGFIGTKAAVLTTWDIFEKSKRVSLIKMIIAKAKKEPTTDWLQDDEKTTLTPTELGNFWIKGHDGVVWEFDQYVLGSYASGPFTFRFSWKELKPFLRTSNPLKSIVVY